MLNYTGDRLFLSRTPYAGVEKVAAVTLSRDGADWEEQIIKELHQEHPYIATRDVKIFITKDDPENGVGVGSIHLDGKLVVPIIIDKFKLAPLDVVWEGGKLSPLTRTSLERKLMSTTPGKPVVPGQGEATDVSMYSRTQAPFDGKYTYASFAGPGEHAVLSKALSKLSDSDRAVLMKDAAFTEVLHDYVAVTAQEKPESDLSPFSLKPILADASKFSKVASAGAYDIATNEGVVPSIVFDCVFRADSTLMPKLGFAVAADGSGRCMDLHPGQVVMGKEAGADTEIKTSKPTVGDTGVFFKVANKAAVCSRPMTLVFENGSGFGAVIDGRTIKVAQASDMLAPGYDGKTLYVPTDWNWIKTGSTVRPITEDSRRVSLDRIVKIARSGDTYGVEVGDTRRMGSRVEAAEFLTEKLGSAAALDAVQTPGSSAMFKLVKRAFPTKKLAAVKPVNLVKEATYVKTIQDLHFPMASRGQLTKIAAVTDDQAKQTVDSMLGLNFLNPETIHRFVSQIDKIDQARDVIAKLLLASRLGLDLDSRPLRTSMFALDSVSRDLKELRNAAEVEEQEG